MAEKNNQNLEEKTEEKHKKDCETRFSLSFGLGLIGGLLAESGAIIAIGDYLQSKGYDSQTSLLISGLPAVIAGMIGALPGLGLAYHYIKKHDGQKKKQNDRTEGIR